MKDSNRKIKKKLKPENLPGIHSKFYIDKLNALNSISRQNQLNFDQRHYSEGYPSLKKTNFDQQPLRESYLVDHVILSNNYGGQNAQSGVIIKKVIDYQVLPCKSTQTIVGEDENFKDRLFKSQIANNRKLKKSQISDVLVVEDQHFNDRLLKSQIANNGKFKRSQIPVLRRVNNHAVDFPNRISAGCDDTRSFGSRPQFACGCCLAGCCCGASYTQTQNPVCGANQSRQKSFVQHTFNNQPCANNTCRFKIVATNDSDRICANQDAELNAIAAATMAGQSCCLCGLSEKERRRLKKCLREQRARKAAAAGGPFGPLIRQMFSPGAARGGPPILGYNSDGTPIYGPPGFTGSLTEYLQRLEAEKLEKLSKMKKSARTEDSRFADGVLGPGGGIFGPGGSVFGAGTGLPGAGKGLGPGSSGGPSGGPGGGFGRGPGGVAGTGLGGGNNALGGGVAGGGPDGGVGIGLGGGAVGVGSNVGGGAAGTGKGPGGGGMGPGGGAAAFGSGPGRGPAGFGGSAAGASGTRKGPGGKSVPGSGKGPGGRGAGIHGAMGGDSGLSSDAIMNFDKSIGDCYPICKYHPHCIPPDECCPRKMGWNWSIPQKICDGRLLLPLNYTPGAVPNCVAKIIKRDRNKLLCPADVVKMKRKQRERLSE